jgi:glycosyltransferase involved in cell wall biosynthesis
MAFFTICSKNFFAYAHTLYDSLRVYYPDVPFFVALCDRLDDSIDITKEPFEIIELDSLDIPDLQEMAQRYNITEFNTAIKPFVFRYLFNAHGFSSVIYFDPDILVIDRLKEVDNFLADGAEAILTPHILEPAENVEVHDQKMLIFGIYNLGFLALSNTERVRKIVDWWARRLQFQCVIKLDEGLFTDQKWVDLFPAFIPGTKILYHPGYNVAYWNLSQRSVTKSDGNWLVNNQPLRFVHFSGHKLEDSILFSRHCAQHKLNQIGDLSLLVAEYRQKILANNHLYYSKLLYAFNWNGTSGVNLHTPQSADELKQCIDMPSVKHETKLDALSLSDKNLPVTMSQRKGFINFLQLQIDYIKLLARALPAAYRISGGIAPLFAGFFRACGQKNINYLKSQILHFASMNLSREIRTEIESVNLLAKEKHPVSDHSPAVLFVDWSVPMPDQDAASVTTMCLLDIFQRLGYRITFLSTSLRYEPKYSEVLIGMGIACIYYPDVTSVEDYLKENAGLFNLIMLCRGPVAGPWLKTICEFAPNAKLVFNTVDLHFVRELRQANIEKSDEGLQKAHQTKEMEFELIRKSDLTIVLSSEELYIIRAEMPEAPLLVLPLIFSDIPGRRMPFALRRDIVFIGSFRHTPNVDAVLYFVEEIFPLVLSRLDGVRFHIVGSNPPKDILDLAERDNVLVHGFVQDIGTIFDNIRLSVAPLRYGAGIKGKIGTSLIYGVPCVATPTAVEGMGMHEGQEILIRDTPERFADAILQVYSDDLLWKQLSDAGLDFVHRNYSIDVAGQRLGNAVNSLMHGWRPVDSYYEIENLDAYEKHRSNLTAEYERRLSFELSILPKNVNSFSTSGFCAICDCSTIFHTSFMYAYEYSPDGQLLPNWREHLSCDHCGQVNRIRAAIHFLHQISPPSQKSHIYITEQVTPLYKWLKDRYPLTQGSEFLGSKVDPGTIKGGIRNEDVTRLSFETGLFDYLLTFDVLEHVPNYLMGIKELYRCLKPGGFMFISVPFAKFSQVNITRASLDDNGCIVHHLPPEFHGNPLDAEGGALCYQYFGWEFLDQLRDIGFHRVRMLVYWSIKYGYLGLEQMLLTAEKPL